MKRIVKHHYLLIILIIFNLLFAILYGADFGDSYDEQFRYENAVEAIDQFANPNPNSRISDKGPIYFVTAKFGGDLIQRLNPALSNIQSWHYIHFASFIFALIGFYSISLNFLSPFEAFFATALFNSQPLLFGHAFINPKDIPFMSLFILTISTGLEMANRLSPPPVHGTLQRSLQKLLKEIKLDWSGLTTIKKIFLSIQIFPVTILLFPLIWKEQFRNWLIINYENLKSGWMKFIADKIALFLYKGNTIDGVKMVIQESFYLKLHILLTTTTLIIVLALIIIFFPRSLKSFLGFSTPKGFFSNLLETFKNPWLYVSGFILGYSISNRSIGVAAGGLVLLYIWINYSQIFLPVLISYLSVGFIFLYISWPGIWANPIIGILRSLLSNTTFLWDGDILFNGNVYIPKTLPFYYFPTLVGIQLTIPALLLFLLGIYVYFKKREEYQLNSTLFTIIFLWSGIPFIAILLLKPSIYDNFRHFLFIIPPLFLISGLGFRFMLSKINSILLTAAVILIMLIPGVLGIINLHPYQYIYYNEFVGGVNGANRNYETDYWYTSYRECISYINDVAEPAATILVFGPAHIIESYAREDLDIIKYLSDDEDEQFQLADYLITGSRNNMDLLLLPEEEIIYSVKQGEAVLSIIRKIDH